MEVFEGTVRMPGDPFELAAVLRVADGQLHVTSHEHELGDWPLGDVSARLRPDGCHLLIGGEELIVTVPHPVRLVDAIGIEWTDPADDSLEEPAPANPTPLDELDPPPPDDGFLAAIPLPWKIGAALVVTLVGLWVFLPTVLVGLLVVVGGALLLGGTVAALDPFTSVRLPELLTPARLLGAGTVVVAAGLAVAVLAA